MTLAGREVESQDLREIDGSVAELAGGIRTYSQDQVDTWRLLPRLALMADGNGGYTSFASKIYEFGMLHVDGDSGGLHGTFVDCATGNIVRQSGELDPEALASDEDVIRAWLPKGEKFDAGKVLTDFQQEAVAPFRGKNELEVMEWRLEIARKLGLRSVFTRDR